MNEVFINKPTPLYEDESCIILNMEALELLKHIKDKAVDLIMTDPPYGVKISRGKNTIGGVGEAKPRVYSDNCIWDNEKLSIEYFKEMFRVAKDLAIFGANYYTDYSEYIKPANSWVIWDKRCTNNMRNCFSDGEMCYVTAKTPLRIYRLVWNGFIRGSKEEKIHPTQKSISVIDYILSLFKLSKNAIVLDIFGGSGSSIKSALKNGYRAIYSDLNKDYCNHIIEYVKEFKKISLF